FNAAGETRKAPVDGGAASMQRKARSACRPGRSRSKRSLKSPAAVHPSAKPVAGTTAAAKIPALRPRTRAAICRHPTPSEDILPDPADPRNQTAEISPNLPIGRRVVTGKFNHPERGD